MKLSNSKKAGLFVGFSVVALGVGSGAFYYQKFMKDSVEGTDRTPQAKSRILIHRGQDLIEDVTSKTNKITNMRGQNLQGISMRNMDLREVDFSHANASNTNVQLSIFSSTKLNSTNFERAKMQGVRIVAEGSDSNCYLTNFRKAKLQRGRFEGIIFRGVDFSGANLKDAYLFGTEIRSAFHKAVDSNESVETVTKLSGAELQRANIAQAELRDVKGKGANFQYANMEGTAIIGGDFRGADFQNVDPLPSFFSVLVDDTIQFDKGLWDFLYLKCVKRSQKDGKLYLTFDPSTDLAGGG